MAQNTPTLMQSEEKYAPWNDTEPQAANFDLNVVVTLSRSIKIKTNNYTVSVDDEGFSCANTENTDWCNEYKEKCYTIPDLLGLLENYVKKDLERYKGNEHKERELKAILEACQGWTVDELEVEGI